MSQNGDLQQIGVNIWNFCTPDFSFMIPEKQWHHNPCHEFHKWQIKDELHIKFSEPDFFALPSCNEFEIDSDERKESQKTMISGRKKTASAWKQLQSAPKSQEDDPDVSTSDMSGHFGKKAPLYNTVISVCAGTGFSKAHVHPPVRVNANLHPTKLQSSCDGHCSFEWDLPWHTRPFPWKPSGSIFWLLIHREWIMDVTGGTSAKATRS